MKRLNLEGEKAIQVLKVVSSRTRFEILELLSTKEMGVTELSKQLSISQPAVTVHLQQLEKVGLVKSEIQQINGTYQKICIRIYDEIIIKLPSIEFIKGPLYYEIDMPVGLYTHFRVLPQCGLVSETEPIGLYDDPNSFYNPQRVFAQLIWFANGFIEYDFPNNLPPNTEPIRLEIHNEICSEAPLSNPDFPSDITVWINNVDIGTWTSPGDFGGTERGKLTPSWWHKNYTQYGLLKHWIVNNAGSYVDGLKISNVTLNDLGINYKIYPEGNSIKVRFGIKEDAKNIGGINIFGEKFGNYPQNIIMRIEYKEKKKGGKIEKKS